MNRKTIVVAAAAGALVVSAGSAWALGTNGDPVRTAATPTTATSTTQPTSSTTSTTTSSTPAARLTADDAARIVQARLGGGVVREVEAEFEHGRLEWKVQIVKDGVRYDIRIDAQTGDVTRAEAKNRGGARVDDRVGDNRDNRDNRGGRDDRGGDDHSGSGNSGSGSSGSGSSGRGGADDPAGDDHGGHGADDPAGDDHGGHGGDDAPGDDHGGDR
jgi:uncharacterized membrane protein YgcG